MTKKIVKSTQTKIRSRVQANNTTNVHIKAMAIKRVRQLQNRKKTSGEISKRSFEKTIKIKQSTMVQKELFESILDQSVFECPVCLQLMIEPTLLQCGHAYCFKCLEEMMIYKSCCGVCRNIQNQSEFQRSKSIENMIQQMIIKKSQNYLDYYCRITDTQNWKRVRNAQISQLSKGSFIDFRDKDLKWRKTQIVKLTFNDQTGHYDMVVKYKKDGQAQQEMIQSDSGRYTKFTYYTRMKYLEPKTNGSQSMEPFIQNDEVMEIPVVGLESLRADIQRTDSYLRLIANQQENDYEQNLESNIEQQYNQQQFSNYCEQQNSQFLIDELLLNHESNEPTEFIELLV